MKLRMNVIRKEKEQEKKGEVEERKKKRNVQKRIIEWAYNPSEQEK